MPEKEHRDAKNGQHTRWRSACASSMMAKPAIRCCRAFARKPCSFSQPLNYTYFPNHLLLIECLTLIVNSQHPASHPTTQRLNAQFNCTWCRYCSSLPSASARLIRRATSSAGGPGGAGGGPPGGSACSLYTDSSCAVGGIFLHHNSCTCKTCLFGTLLNFQQNHECVYECPLNHNNRSILVPASANIMP